MLLLKTASAGMPLIFTFTVSAGGPVTVIGRAIEPSSLTDNEDGTESTGETTPYFLVDSVLPAPADKVSMPVPALIVEFEPAVSVSLPLPAVIELLSPTITVSLPLPAVTLLDAPTVIESLPLPTVIFSFVPPRTQSFPLPSVMLSFVPPMTTSLPLPPVTFPKLASTTVGPFPMVTVCRAAAAMYCTPTCVTVIESVA